MDGAAETRGYQARTRWLIAAGLLLGTLALYARVAGHPFIFFDDNRYVTENPTVQAGLTWQGITWAFTTLHVSNWHPLTWLSHMLDVELFGVNPGAHHVVNVLFHAANAVLVFLLFLRMTGATWRSAFVAALFAVHPTHVESVAWVAERKDVLSTLFGLLAMLVYVGWTRRGGAGRYLGVVALFAASLLSKPMWVTLPFLLLLLDAWPLQRWAGSPVPVDPEPPASPRLGLGRLVLEKLPLLALSIASSAVTVVAQSQGGAMVNLDLGMGARIGNAAVAYVRYVAKTFWPTDLAIYYPHPAGGLPTGQAIGAAAVVVLATAVAFLAVKRAPWFALGWFWFLGTLVPVIGLVQVGAQAMADRYTYVPTIGLYVVVAWGLAGIARRWNLGKGAAAAAGAAILALSAVTWNQVGYWSDHILLFEHALAVEPRSGVAVGVLSEGMRRAKRYDEALALAQEAVALAPGNGAAPEQPRHLVPGPETVRGGPGGPRGRRPDRPFLPHQLAQPGARGDGPGTRAPGHRRLRGGAGEGSGEPFRRREPGGPLPVDGAIPRGVVGLRAGHAARPVERRRLVEPGRLSRQGGTPARGRGGVPRGAEAGPGESGHPAEAGGTPDAPGALNSAPAAHLVGGGGGRGGLCGRRGLLLRGLLVDRLGALREADVVAEAPPAAPDLDPLLLAVLVGRALDAGLHEGLLGALQHGHELGVLPGRLRVALLRAARTTPWRP